MSKGKKKAHRRGTGAKNRARTGRDVDILFLNRIHSANVELIKSGLLPPDIDQSKIKVEVPRDSSHGHLASNNAIVLAKAAGKSPHEIANAHVEILRKKRYYSGIEIAGGGFENVTLKPADLHKALLTAVRLGSKYGKANIGRAARVNIEYVSANPTGPMHVGHCRGAVFGDALANLLAFTGFKVTREYYINDAGAQIDQLARSVYWRYREALGEEIGPIPYPGEYLKPVGEMIARNYHPALKDLDEKNALSVIRKIAVNAMMGMILEDLATLGIRQDYFFSELGLVYQESAGKDSIDHVAETIKRLRDQGYVFEGRLPRPRGGSAEDWEDREQTLFRSTAFGDSIDRPLIKSDGSYTYFASDIAYHADKLERGFRSLIDVWGADHAGYIKRMQAAVAALSDRAAELDVKVVQLVKLLRAGAPVTMSKRAGEFVTLRDVVDEVGRDAVRFMMLFRKNDAVLEFDLAKVVEQSRDNPVFYVQYGHARAQSVFRNARSAFPDLAEDIADLADVARLERLNDPAELALVRRIADYPRVVRAAAAAHEPHRIAFYLFDLASEFHSLWTLGNSSPHLRFIIQNDRELTEARLVLVKGLSTVLASGLALLGVEAPNEMR
jgi:arginyl-tRNA synthetase